MDEYRKQEAKIVGVALLWKGEATTGLASLAAHGDVGGLLAAELARLKRARKLPEGWSNYFSLGGGAEVFTRAENGEILCESAGAASIIERPLAVPFSARQNSAGAGRSTSSPPLSRKIRRRSTIISRSA